MIFKTESGSMYELDKDNKKVRRLHGLDNNSSSFKNEDWMTYHDMSFELGKRAIFDWKGDGKITITTRIIEVTERN